MASKAPLPSSPRWPGLWTAGRRRGRLLGSVPGVTGWEGDPKDSSTLLVLGVFKSTKASLTQSLSLRAPAAWRLPVSLPQPCWRPSLAKGTLFTRLGQPESSDDGSPVAVAIVQSLPCAGRCLTTTSHSALQGPTPQILGTVGGPGSTGGRNCCPLSHLPSGL